jgi:osmotically-inducible protein OsmY
MRIERQIRRETSDKVRDLHVEVRRDSVVLEGRCGTFYSKQLASHAAMALCGVTPVINQIDVW